MADQNGTVPAAQPAPAAAQPASGQSFNVPDGYQLTPKADMERYSRYEQQVRGFEPLYQKLNKSGIKSAEDWAAYEPLISTARDRKIDAKAFASMFSPEAEADLKTKGSEGLDIETLRSQIKNEVFDEVYKDRHEEARKGDDSIIEKAFSRVLGDGEHDEYTKSVTKYAVSQYLKDNRITYPEGHRLHGKFLAPITQEQADKAVEYFTGLKAKQKGTEMEERAKAANSVKPKTGTPAGGGGAPSGKPDTTSGSQMDQKRAKAEQIYAQIQAKRASAAS